jgi:type II secretory pathway pseudopilin PulG
MFFLNNIKKNKGFTQHYFAGQNSAGFTIIELIVAIGLFIVVSLVALGSLLSIVDVNRKTQSTKSILNNLNFAVESMSKSMRVGSAYHCGAGGVQIDSPQNCVSGDSYIAFESSKGDRDNSGDQIVYRMSGNRLERSKDSGANFIGVTAPEVELTPGTGVRFYVLGTTPGDNAQPRIIIVLSGKVGIKDKTSTDFNIYTSVSQRELDE